MIQALLILSDISIRSSPPIAGVPTRLISCARSGLSKRRQKRSWEEALLGIKGALSAQRRAVGGAGHLPLSGICDMHGWWFGEDEVAEVGATQRRGRRGRITAGLRYSWR